MTAATEQLTANKRWSGLGTRAISAIVLAVPALAAVYARPTLVHATDHLCRSGHGLGMDEHVSPPALMAADWKHIHRYSMRGDDLAS